MMNIDNSDEDVTSEDEDDGDGEEDGLSPVSVPTYSTDNCVAWPSTTNQTPANPTNLVYQIVNTSPVYNVLQPLQAAPSPVVYLAGANALPLQPQHIQLQHQNTTPEVQLQPQGVIITPVYNISGHATASAPLLYVQHQQQHPEIVPISVYEPKDLVEVGKQQLVENVCDEKDCNLNETTPVKDDEVEIFGKENESDLLLDENTNDIFNLLDSNDKLDIDLFEELQSSLKLLIEEDEMEAKAKAKDSSEDSSGKVPHKTVSNIRDIIEIVPLGQDYHPSNVIKLIPELHLKEIAAGGNIFEDENSRDSNFVVPYTKYGELVIGNTTITKIPLSNGNNVNNKPNFEEQRLRTRTKVKESPAEKRTRSKRKRDGESPEKRKERLRHLANLARMRRSMETEEERRFRLDRNSRQKKEKRRQNKSQYVFHVQLLPNGKYVTTCIPKSN